MRARIRHIAVAIVAIVGVLFGAGPVASAASACGDAEDACCCHQASDDERECPPGARLEASMACCAQSPAAPATPVPLGPVASELAPQPTMAVAIDAPRPASPPRIAVPASPPAQPPPTITIRLLI